MMTKTALKLTSKLDSNKLDAVLLKAVIDSGQTYAFGLRFILFGIFKIPLWSDSHFNSLIFLGIFFKHYDISFKIKGKM